MSDTGSIDSDEMTAEAQNVTNADTDTMHSLLGNFLQAKEETLEDLVGGLMYLTMEDLQKSGNPSVARALRQGSSGCGEPSLQPEGEQRQGGRVCGGGAPPVVTSPQTPETQGTSTNTAREGDDLEEQILDDCTRSAEQDTGNLFRQRPASLTKFDNFVLSEEEGGVDGDGEKEEEEEIDGWITTSGYCASFASDDTDMKNARKEEQKVYHRNASEDVQETQQQQDTCASTPTATTQHELVSGSPRHSSRAGDISQVVQAACLQTVGGADTEGPDQCSADCDVDSVAPFGDLNPGEVEEEVNAAPVTTNVSVMEFLSRTVSDGSTLKQEQALQDSQEPCCDEVIPFSLDEDFDYDSVPYTPKFTRAEIDYLASFLPPQSS